MNQQVDEIDLQILRIVQSDGRISNAKLAKQINLSPAATHKRQRRLENLGIISGYAATIELEKLGYGLHCYINISMKVHSNDELMNFRQVLYEMPEVLACSFVTGEYDCLARVVLRDRDHLEQFVLNKLTTFPSVTRVNTSLIVADIKTQPSPQLLADLAE